MVAAGTLDLGIDWTALVQEFLPAAGGSITRLELLDGHLLYAIRITPPEDHGFNLCPADICQAPDRISEDATLTAAGTDSSTAAVQGMCAVKPSMQIEAADAPDELVRLARRLARRAGLDVCGIEYLADARDGRPSFYDVNALSNFVTDAPRIIGFDPFDRFVDSHGVVGTNRDEPVRRRSPRVRARGTKRRGGRTPGATARSAL
jgi:hypothetical protein